MKQRMMALVALMTIAYSCYAQRVVDKLDRGLVAMKVSKGVFLSWRVLGEEYYDVQYNVYRDGTKVADPENMYLAPQNGFKPSICKNPAAPYRTAGDIAHGKLCYNLDMNEAWYMPAAEFTGGAPILIQLVPGKDDTMESWFKIAGADMMADILIAQKRIKPCILTTSKLDFMKQAGNDRLPNVKTLRADDFKTWAERRQALEKLLLSCAE